MSDLPQGPGWWQASDARWYPPESRRDDAAAGGPDLARQAALQPPRRTSYATFAVIGAVAVVAMFALVVVGVALLRNSGKPAVEAVRTPISGKDQEARCRIDTRTLRTAMEAAAQDPTGGGRYRPESELVTGGFLSEESTLHDVTIDSSPGGFTLTITDARCGTIGHRVGQTAEDI